MPEFFYKGIDQAGRNENGSLEASSEKLAFDTLSSRGITVFELSERSLETETKTSWLLRDIQFGSARLPPGEQANVAELLASLFRAKLAATEIIRIVASTTHHAEVRRHFERTGQRVADGVQFSYAFAAENRSFSLLFVSFLKVGDTANTAPLLLDSLAEHLRTQSATDRKITSALVYPMILVLAAIALTMVVVFFLAPSLEPIFLAAGQQTPTILSACLRVGDFLSNYWLHSLLTTIAFVFSVIALVQSPALKTYFRTARFRLPLVGPMARDALIVQLCVATRLLLLSGEPLLAALRGAVAAMGDNDRISEAFSEASEALEQGVSAASAFRAYPELPGVFLELFEVGETTNTLPDALNSIREVLSAQTEVRAQRLLSLITPVLTLVLGLGIGTLIYAIMGAVLEINEIAF
ncbi:type II secretion system F family protein [Thalassococcus lentus]|uniref:Type II secretion system F family protein n=1 Tax=Thalassococcus lentus TaxID=1210524 RepID=A0ABT4XUG8_9RHOB|nr:type II secretion system F family protein [Thalassococcus lentus]MDA7425614.1 type II secretion system F family protein [Thalassococcus lentus]